MTITQSNYLDIGNLIINEFFGDFYLYLIVGLIIITYACIKRNIPISGILAADGIFIGISMSYYYSPFVWILLMIIFGFVIYGLFSKMTKR